MKTFTLFLKPLRQSFGDLLPIILVIAFFQIFILQQFPQNITSIIIGLIIVAIGLALFIQGLEIGIFPIGESLAHEFAAKGSVIWLMVFAFAIGFSTTIAEPALIAIAKKAQLISYDRLDANLLRLTVALSVGFAIALGTWRIITGHPIHLYIITGYIIVVILTFFVPKEIVGLAYDSGGVTTSTVTVPLVAALGVGLASSIRGRNPVIDGFGLIAFASLTPMIFVQVYGLVVYEWLPEPIHKDMLPLDANAIVVNTFSYWYLFDELINVFKDIFPILAVIFFFQYAIIKAKLPNLLRIGSGIVFVIIGLYAFIIGLEMGLFPIGETMALQLAAQDNLFYIYLFGFLIGFATTMAEPALLAVTMKVEEISQKRIRQIILRLAVAFGVAVGIALGAYRIIQGDSIHYYIIIGYSLVIVMTFLSPKEIIPIAYDSGGVTTSTVTVPLVAALGLGLATQIQGRSPLIDGFGLIAFASLFPMITVMGYGILGRYLAYREQRRTSTASIDITTESTKESKKE